MGLYDDDKKKVTEGELKHPAYKPSRTRYDDLQNMLKKQMPEYNIAQHLVGMLQSLDTIWKEYPNHKEVNKWRDEAIGIVKKLDEETIKKFAPLKKWRG